MKHGVIHYAAPPGRPWSCRASPRGRSTPRRPEINPNPQRELPKCECLGPARLRKSISLGVRVSFGVVHSGSTDVAGGRPCASGTTEISGVHKGGFSKGGFSNLCVSLVQL